MGQDTGVFSRGLRIELSRRVLLSRDSRKRPLIAYDEISRRAWIASVSLNFKTSRVCRKSASPLEILLALASVSRGNREGKKEDFHFLVYSASLPDADRLEGTNL